MLRCAVLLVVTSCGRSPAPTTTIDGAADNGAPDTYADTTFTYEGTTCSIAGDPESVCCKPEAQRPVPSSVTTVIDLSSTETVPIGTCGSYFFDSPPSRLGYRLPVDPAAYPLKVILPTLTGADPACASTCGDMTAFGIALETEGLIGGDTGRALAVLVPEPWRFVSGGCGEACAWPCLDGYQEFGIRTCITFSYGDFGFATADPAAPSVEALVDLVAVATPGELGSAKCCVFR